MVAKEAARTLEERATRAVIIAGRRITDEGALARLVARRLVSRKRGEWGPAAIGREALAQDPASLLGPESTGRLHVEQAL